MLTALDAMFEASFARLSADWYAVDCARDGLTDKRVCVAGGLEF